MKEKIENFFLWKWLLKTERAVMIFCCISVIVLIGIGVVCRYVLQINFQAKDEILMILAMWLYFIGGVEGGNYRDNHIKADVATLIFKSEKMRYILEIVVKAISFIVSILLAIWAIQYLELVLMIGGRTTVLGLPVLCSRLALVVGYVLPVIYTAFHLLMAILGQEKNKINTDNENGGELA